MKHLILLLAMVGCSPAYAERDTSANMCLDNAELGGFLNMLDVPIEYAYQRITVYATAETVVWVYLPSAKCWVLDTQGTPV